VITIARSGDTSLVVKTGRDSAASPSRPASAESARVADTLTAPDATASPVGIGNQPSDATRSATVSASPTVVPADLDALRREGLVVPVAGVQAKDLIDSFDDMRGGTRHHNALDIMAQRNTPVLAATSGAVLKMHNSTAGGLSIYQSDPSSRFVLMYGHLNSYRPGLKEGAQVKRGEIIGFVGSTGNASPLAPHLHFQITRNDNLKEWWKGTPVNPFPVLRPK
jgi:murein DD-endopeptidase MepM/ murein hydrolase activator NlpD